MNFAPGMRQGRSRRTARVAPALIAAALTIAACSGSDGETLEPEATDSTSAPETLSADTAPEDTGAPSTTSTTTASTTSTTVTPTTTTEPAPEPPPVETVSEVWAAAWTTAGTPGATVEDLADLTTPEVADRLITTLQHEGGQRTVVNVPTIGEPTDDGTVPINDCLLIDPPATVVAANWYSGTANTDDNGVTRITSLTPESITGCVPKATADEALADYERYWDVLDEVWVPADPSTTLLQEVASGAHFAQIQGLLVQHADQGIELRGRPETHAEIIEYRSQTELVILDCQVVNPEFGLYSSASGDRLRDPPPPVDRQRDVRSSTMVFEDGHWKNTDRQGVTNASCEFAPTDGGAPVV